MLIPFDMVQSPQVSRVKNLDQPFRQHDHPIGAPSTKPLDHRPDHEIPHTLESHRPLPKFLGNDGERGAGCLADSERQMAGFAPHRHNKVPARRGTGVHHEILDDLDGEMPGRLKAECRNAIREIEVIVDGLRHMHNLREPGRLFFQFQR